MENNNARGTDVAQPMCRQTRPCFFKILGQILGFKLGFPRFGCPYRVCHWLLEAIRECRWLLETIQECHWHLETTRWCPRHPGGQTWHHQTRRIRKVSRNRIGGNCENCPKMVPKLTSDCPWVILKQAKPPTPSLKLLQVLKRAIRSKSGLANQEEINGEEMALSTLSRIEASKQKNCDQT